MIDQGPWLLARAAMRRPQWTLIVGLTCVLAAAPGLVRLELRTDGHALVPPHHPAVELDSDVRRHFGLRDPVVVLIETSHPSGLYNPATLRIVQEVSTALADIDSIGPHHVMSLATERRDRVYPGTLKFRPYLDPLPDTPHLMELLRSDVDAAQILHGTLLSKDATAAVVLAGLPTLEEGYDRTAIYRQVRATVEPFETATDRLSVVGAPVAEALLGSHIIEDLTVLLPLALLVIAGLVWLGCRRLWGVVLAFLEVGACLVFTFGLMGWLGAPVYLTTAVLPVILTTMGLADEIHIFWHYQRVLARTGVGGPATAAVETTMRNMSRPVFLTSLTTSIAFLSFLSSTITPVRLFGLFAAAGILFCLLWSLSVVPALLVLLPSEWMVRPGGRLERGPGFGLAWLEPLLRRRRLVLCVLGLVTLGLGLGIPRLYVQDSWIDGFAPGSPFRQATDRANALLHGTHQLLVHLTFDPPPVEVPRGYRRQGPLLSPKFLNAIGDLETFLRSQPGVGGVLGTHSHLSTVAYLWLARRQGGRQIPTDTRRVERLLERFDQGRGERRRREVLDDDLRRTLVTIFLKQANYRDTAVLMASIRDYAARHLEPLNARIEFAGDVAVSQAMIPAIVRTQVLSLLLALGGAFLAICLLTRSLTTGFLAVLPASLAVVWVFGAMGWAGIALGVATSMFCAITLGIGVDYAVHLLEAWNRTRQAIGAARPPTEVVWRAVQEAGPAILTDTLAIALGFGLLAASQVPANARLGLLVATALLAGCVLTLLGLGAVLGRRTGGQLSPLHDRGPAIVSLVDCAHE